MSIIRRAFGRLGLGGGRSAHDSGAEGGARGGTFDTADAGSAGSNDVPQLVHATPAATVRMIAGAPIGMATDVSRRGSRRGTVLIIVLGTLALIAVIAVMYAVVGRADRRASAAFESSVRREEMPALVRDYIADIVGRDTMATYRDGAGDLKREAFDYPFTDPMMRSIPAGQAGVANMQPVTSDLRRMVRFNPEGTFADPMTTDMTLAQVANLGSLGNPNAVLVPSDPWLSATQPSNLRLDDDQPDGGFPQFNMRDWANISNLAPDGRFVNLWNLRNNFASASGFNFNNREISSRLTLNGPNGLPFTTSVPQQRDDGTIASPNIPAHWTSRQRGAFRPATGLPSIGWSEDEFPAYQWADADGDGFFDSRWFEFVDLSAGVSAARELFPRDDGFRWFAAARVVDLSAAININVATDFLADPDSVAGAVPYAGAGGTPSDIDLRRLLTGEDARELAGGAGYNGLRQPALPGTSTVDPNSAQYTGAIFSQTDPLAGSEFIGDAAYNSARYFLEFGLVTPASVRLRPDAGYSAFIGYLSAQHNAPLLPTTLLRQQRVADRSGWFDLVSGSVLGGDLSVSLFTVDSEAELLTFRSANDPAFASTLELVVDGRFDNGTNNAPATTSWRYGVLRSQRQGQVERADRDRSTGLVAPGALGPAVADGIADLDSMTQMLVDTRQYLTTISASRPLRNSLIATASPVPALTAGDSPRAVSSAASSINSLFKVYSDALLPYSGLIQTWLPQGDPAGDSYRTLSYGYAGSELAIHHAAHLAVNMADAIDSDSTPRVATVLVDENLRDDLNADFDPPPPPGQNPTGTVFVLPMGVGGTGRSNPWAAWVDGGTFDLGASRLADSAQNATPITPAFNVYGLEPQPFIAEVSAFVLYTDAPDSAGGDDEPDHSEVTIDGSLDAANADLAFQAIAFQITNPLGVSIDLSGNSTLQESKFYIEFGGRCYRFPNADPSQPSWSGTLGAHETRVFYVPNRPRVDTEARWEAIETGTSARLSDYLSTVMGINGLGGGGPVQLAEFDPEDGANVGFATGSFVNRFAAVGGGTIGEARLWRTYLAPGTTSASAPAETYNQNARQNDILADRFRDPEASSGNPATLIPELNLTAGTSPNSVANALKIPPAPGETETDYDTGLTVMLWSTVRRPSDPDTAPTAASAAAADELVWIPAYCLEPKFGATYNTVADEGIPRTSLSNTDFDSGSRVELALAFSSFLVTAQGSTFIDTLTTDPRLKNHNDIGPNLQGQTWSELRAEFHQDVGDNNAPGNRGLRPFDMLMAKAIGPSLEVDASLTPTPLGWTTLGEATLIALDYNQGTQGVNVVWRPGRPPAGPGSLNRGSVDKGHLLYDQFVPFFDANPNNQPFDPANDIVYGDGQPLALGVVGAFRGLGDAFGTYRRATPGLININTAPLAVLRTLPMLSPTHGTDPAVFPPSTPGSAWKATLAATGQGLLSDAASMLIAGRDRVTIFPRGDAVGNPPVAPNDVIDFEIGRRVTTGIQGISEVPGFRSVGEVLALRDGAIRTAGDPPVPGLHDMDRLGLDGVRMAALGFDPVVPSVATPVDRMVDEFDERLVLANAISNCVTVRSDVYAVWFVLHGYSQSDCSGLSTDDPLLPSVSRRFLMILDRSNVVAPGDKPAILLFREVPYSPTTAGDGSAI